MLYQLIAEVNQRIEFTQAEIYGSQYLRPLVQLLQDVPQSQLIASRYFAREAPATAVLQQQEKMEQDMQAVAQTQQALGDRLKFAALQQAWQPLQVSLVRQLAQPDFRIAQVAIATRHTQLIATVRDLISRVGDTSNLILDPDHEFLYSCPVAAGDRPT